jgi:dienelactone hydrolase
MAANFVRKNPAVTDGMALLAAYPASSDDLTESPVQVSSIFATLDGLTSAEDIEASKQLLPANTAYVSIEGGNHGQFGWYGDQRGDNPATISRDDQQTQVLEAIIELFQNLK